MKAAEEPVELVIPTMRKINLKILIPELVMEKEAIKLRYMYRL